jgi:hypothetical protein
MSFFGNVVNGVVGGGAQLLGHAVNGVSQPFESLAGTDLNPGGGLVNTGKSITNSSVNYKGAANPIAGSASKSASNGGQVQDNASDPYADAIAGYGSGGGLSSSDQAYISSQLDNLNSLLGRTQTGLDQGLSTLNNSYQSNVNQQQNQENQALQDYGDKRIQTNKDKLGAYNTINQNANNGYRSLAQLIGRSAGSGSSAFQDLLPDVVGKDTSSKRGDANLTYANNLGNIDNAQKKTELSFQGILSDLANQRAAQEQQLRTGVESQRQNILGQQQSLQAQQGNAAGARALQPAIENSRNAVESFFNQFQPTITAQQAAIAAPDLSQYTTDRSVVNAQNQGISDPTNPYADILRKKLQDQAV